MTCIVHLYCGCFVYICLLEVHLLPGAHCTNPWLLIVDSRSVYPYTSLNTYGYSWWTPVIAPKSFLSQPTKWLVCFLSPPPLTVTCPKLDANPLTSISGCFSRWLTCKPCSPSAPLDQPKSPVQDLL